MKRFLQPCKMSGSLYGIGKNKDKKKHPSPMKNTKKEDLVSSYEKLYKTQYVKMTKLFNASK